MKRSLSLKQSTFLAITIASAFLILAFTHIQLTRETIRTSEHQIRETKLSLILVKATLESRLKSDPGLSTASLASIVSEIIAQAPALEHSLLLDKNGGVLFPDQARNLDAASDQDRIREILLTYDLTGQWFKLMKNPSRSDALDILTPIFSDSRPAYFLKTTITQDSLQSAFQRTYHLVFLIFLMVILFAVFLAVRMKKKILDPLKALSGYTDEIAQGHLDQKIKIETGDEIEELADSFNQMAKQLTEMKRRAEDANPLTHLPGNKVISAEIEARLKRGSKIAVIHADIDRFKIYNDTYGLPRGDEVIQMTADIIKQAVREKGSGNDLAAHEGGDDFVIVTSPAHVKAVGEEIILKFDKQRGGLYREEDRRKGYVMAENRRDLETEKPEEVPVPLMSISLAAITNENRHFSSYFEISSRLVQIKKKAKDTKGSVFILET